MDQPGAPPSPRKKLKMEDGNVVNIGEAAVGGLSGSSKDMSEIPNLETTLKVKTEDVGKELDVGIHQYVHPSTAGFVGVLKKRYTDFLVNEIMPDGTPIHLDSYAVPRPASISAANNVAAKNSTSLVSNKERTDLKPSGKDVTMKDDPNQESDQQHPDGLVPLIEPDIDLHHDSRLAKVAESIPPHQENAEGAEDAIMEESAPGSKWREYAGSHPAFQLSSEDRTTLEDALGPSVTDEALKLFNSIVDFPNKKPSQYGVVKSEAPIDRYSRTMLHQAIRRIFVERIESYTEDNGIFVLAAPQQNSRASGSGPRGKQGRGRGGRDRGESSRGSGKSLKNRFAELGGDYCHFSLYKENKDTMEVVSFLARQLQIAPKQFNFAGTKDRRAVTVQRVSAYRVFADRLNQLNGRLRGSQVGNFAYEKSGLSLGDLRGNEFVITLRDCTIQGAQSHPVKDKVQQLEAALKTAVQNLAQDGFLNYYGLQRFGTFTMRTDTVGVKLLSGDYQGAVDSILHFNPDLLEAADKFDAFRMTYSFDEIARATAIDMFRKKNRLHDVLDKLPRKFSAENNLIKFLASDGKQTDFLGAIQMIPRNLRMMYSHAYQSGVWNHAASHRWNLAGAQLLEGDLVLVSEHKDKEVHVELDNAEVDEDGEPIIRPSGEDRAVAEDERFERARPLSKEEVESGQYDIFDIVLPTPGFDILYPSYMLGFYEELMARKEFGGLDPHKMKRNVKDLSLSGNYRKLLAKPIGSCKYRVVPYADENYQFVQTDFEKVREKRELQKQEENAAPKQLSHEAANDMRENDLEMGLDGAMESKMKDVKDALLGANQAPVDTTADANPPEEQSNKEGTDLPQAASESGIQKDTAVEKIAVVLMLQLGSGTYATMALRELSKGGIVAYKPDFGGGR